MPGLKAIDAKRTALRKLAEQLDKQEKALVRRRRITCEKGSATWGKGCGGTSPLSSWGFIQGHWYTGPYSCASGDYWNLHKVEHCHIVCPQCGARNYLYHHSARAKFLALEGRFKYDFLSLFAKVWDQYGDEKPELRASKNP